MNRSDHLPRRIRRLTVSGTLAVLLGVAAVGCSSDDSDSASTEAVSGAGTTAPSSDAGAQTGTASGGSSGGGSSSGGSSGGGGQPTGGGPTINSFDTPESIDCHNDNFQMFTASWSTTDAVNVTISIDGAGVYNTYDANGEASLPFNCSSSHTFLLTAHGEGGQTSTRSVTLEPRNVQSQTPEPDETTTTAP